MAELHYYFDDKEAPDGWHWYHLQNSGLSRELSRDGQRVEAQRLVLQVLEYFLQRPHKAVEREELRDEFHCDPNHYISKIRRLLNDTDRCKLIQKAETGSVTFAVDVRDHPSLYYATYREQLQNHWRPRAMGSGNLFLGDQWYFS